ncbi:MAG: tail fiber domain-containing protein [Kangiellaceae bacterium]|nr:tail fiber domain-containing protein [Kangiellaceae bacterium]
MSIKRKVLLAAVLTAGGATAGTANADIIHTDDVIINGGSLCVGMDCVNGENFGFDTLRLKENNLRIHFNDTSASGSFPSNDWRITANDSSNGGANKFSIDDVDAGRTPFTIEAGAQANTLYVEADGDVGIKTSNPVVDLHMVEGNTPTMRLEQDGSDGFSAQSWDVAGNETNFFVRDVSNGSKLPFRIKPNAPTDSIYIDTDGVGIGTNNPTEALHIRGSDGDTSLLVEDVSASTAARTLVEMINNGSPSFSMTNSSSAVGWKLGMGGSDNFILSKIGGAGSELSIGTNGSTRIGPSGAQNFVLSSTGNLTIAGTLTQGSDVNSKTNITEIDKQEVLNKLTKLPIKKWQYKTDDLGVNHVGPMAQDFHAIFGLNGEEDTRIATLDMAGVSIAAIQALTDRLEAQEKEIELLKSKLAESATVD